MSSDGQTSSSRPTEILLAQQSVFRIAGKASDVSINQQGIIQMAWDVLIYLDNAFQNGEFENVMCKFTRHSDLYPDCNDNRAADWIFVLHTLNFSLWSPKGTDPWTVNGYTGFLALCAAMKRAIMKGKPIWNPNYYKELFQKPEDVEIIFQSDNGTCIPMLKERVDLLHEIGKILTEYYKGTFVTCLKLHKNGIDLLILVARNFPSYQEKMVQYEGETVSFCLKAFLLIGDMVCFFHEHKEINIETIFPTTIFVDFRIIQLFLKYKALQYTDRLKKKIEENDTLEFGSTENLEIIACTYMIRSQLSVELLKLVKRHKTTNLNKQKLINEACTTNFEILIDNFLWYYRHAHDQYLMENVLLHNVVIYLDEAIQNGGIGRVTSKFSRYYTGLHPDFNDDRAANWIFVLHTLNFSLWSPKDTDPWIVNGFTGFLALCAAMKRVVNDMQTQRSMSATT